MPNMMDYLLWRGDLTFRQDEFNDVDNLILAQLAYISFDGIIPAEESSDSITVREAADRFFSVHSPEELAADKSFVACTPEVLRLMAKSRRFSKARLSHYRKKTDEGRSMQFAAFHVLLGDGSIYLSFQGTDDSIFGWKEDFNMSYQIVGAQKEALDYLEHTTRGQFRKVRVGGHSKGGSLAVYAAACASGRTRFKISHVYNNDGPGVSMRVIKSKGYADILPRIRTIVPADSRIGMLFEHADQETVVESSQRGLLCHDACSWQICGNTFLRAKERTVKSRMFEQNMKNWLKGFTVQEKKDFVDSFFSVLEASGAKNLSEVTTEGMHHIVQVLKTMYDLDARTKEQIQELFRLLFSGSAEKKHRKLFIKR